MTFSWHTPVALTLAASTIVFGAVYPWGYYPLFAVAAVIGLVGVAHTGREREQWRALRVSLSVIVAAGVMQCVPLPSWALYVVTPHAPELLEQLSLTFAGTHGPHALSIAPTATMVALTGLAGLGLYLAGLPALLTATDVRRLPRDVMLFAVPLAVFGIVTRERNNGLIYWFWRPVDGGGANAYGPFVNRNHFAGWMLMAVCLALGALLGMMERLARAGRPATRSVSSRDLSRIVLAAAGTGVMMLSLIWTMSRSGMVGLACALMCLAGLIVQRRRLGSTGRRVSLAMLVALAVAGVAWRGLDRLGLWFADTTDLYGRLDAWRDGWQLVRHFPLTGTGLNTYPIAMLFYQRHNPAVIVAQAHNDYLQLLAEGGLLIMMPTVAAVVALALAIRRNLCRAEQQIRGYWIRAGAAVGLVAIAVQETVEFSMQMPANALLFCTLAGLVLAPVEDARQP